MLARAVTELSSVDGRSLDGAVVSSTLVQLADHMKPASAIGMHYDPGPGPGVCWREHQLRTSSPKALHHPSQSRQQDFLLSALSAQCTQRSTAPFSS